MLSAGLKDQLDPPPGETLCNIARRHRVLARLRDVQASATREDEGQDQLFSEVRPQTRSGESWVAGDDRPAELTACFPAMIRTGGKTGIAALARTSGHRPSSGDSCSGLGTTGRRPWRSRRLAKRSSKHIGTLARAKPSDALRPGLWASGRPTMSEASVPAGQHKKSAPSGAGQRPAGQRASTKPSRSASLLLIATRMGRDYRPGSPEANRAGRPQGSASSSNRGQVSGTRSIVDDRSTARGSQAEGWWTYPMLSIRPESRR